jgi:hypothetical protein
LIGFIERKKLLDFLLYKILVTSFQLNSSTTITPKAAGTKIVDRQSTAAYVHDVLKKKKLQVNVYVSFVHIILSKVYCLVDR